MKTAKCMRKAMRPAAALSGALLASGLFAPQLALAEEEASSGITLLIPAIAELIPACIAFIIVFIVLSKMVWPAVVKMMDAREDSLKAQYDAADEAREKAAEIIAQAESERDAAQAEAKRIVDHAKMQAEAERNRICSEAQAQAAEIIEKGRKSIDAERERAMDALSRSVADLSVEIAGKIIGESLDDEQHLALASRLLDEMGNEDARH